MRVKIRLSDIVWQYISVILAYGSSLILLPISLYFLTGDMLGLWQIFLSIGTFANILDFGFKPTIARNVMYCWSGAHSLLRTGATKVDSNSIDQTLFINTSNSCKAIYTGISFIALLLLSTVGTAYIRHIGGNGLDDLAYVSWWIYIFAIVVNLLFSYYGSLLLGVGGVKEAARATTISRVIRLTVSIALMFFGLGILGLVIGHLLGGIMYRFIARRSYRKIVGGVIKENNKFSFAATKDTLGVIWFNARKDGLVTVSNYLMGQVSTIVCSLYLPLSETGTYSVSVQLVTAVASLSAALYSAYQPLLQASYVINDTARIKQLMSRAILCFLVFFSLGTFAVLLVGIPVLSIIKPTASFSPAVFLLYGAYELLNKHQSLWASFISNTNNVPYCRAYIVFGCINVAVTATVLNFTHSLELMVISSILVMLSYNAWKWPREGCKLLNLREDELIKEELINLFSYVKGKYKNGLKNENSNI